MEEKTVQKLKTIKSFIDLILEEKENEIEQEEVKQEEIKRNEEIVEQLPNGSFIKKKKDSDFINGDAFKSILTNKDREEIAKRIKEYQDISNLADKAEGINENSLKNFIDIDYLQKKINELKKEKENINTNKKPNKKENIKKTSKKTSKKSNKKSTKKTTKKNSKKTGKKTI